MTTNTVVNGVDVDQLVETVGAIQAEPEIANFRFRAHNEWINGGHSKTTIQSFYGAGQEDESRNEPIVLESDEPPVLLGEGKGANAVESVLHALASCLSVGFAYNAGAKGTQVDGMEMDLEGDLDLHGFLGLSEDTRPGYDNIRVTCKVSTDASEDQLAELSDHVQKTSPVLDLLRNPVPTSVHLEKMA
ncbi:OsmC family protein [Thiohalorhabdus sp. Cl-TMA]|uniref:OsmC family protein n=1 Tax=Thiohalorhabdus methylotrophus TaxID=3242694 RepID=A0ABV4U0E0_9GAMM